MHLLLMLNLKVSNTFTNPYMTHDIQARDLLQKTSRIVNFLNEYPTKNKKNTDTYWSKIALGNLQIVA